MALTRTFEVQPATPAAKNLKPALDIEGYLSFMKKYCPDGKYSPTSRKPDAKPAVQMVPQVTPMIVAPESTSVTTLAIKPISLPSAPPPNVTDPVYVFDTPEHFARIHRYGTEKEMEVEATMVENYNKMKHAISAWAVIRQVHSESEEQDVYFVVQKEDHFERFLSNEGQKIGLEIVDPATNKARSVMWPARRVNNFCGVLDNGNQVLNNHIFLKISTTVSDDNSVVLPLLNGKDGLDQLSTLRLDQSNGITVHLNFSDSQATYETELRALDKLMDPKPAPGTVTLEQQAAFNYIMTFKQPEQTVDLFEEFPWMRNPLDPAFSIPSSIMEKYKRLNEHQRAAYHGLFTSLPSRVGLIPGGPGSGKTATIITVVSLMQCNSNAKVLCVLDINKPLDDTARKYVRAMEQAGLKKTAIRLRSFGAEIKNSNRFDSVRAKAKKVNIVAADEDPDVDIVAAFMAMLRSEGKKPYEQEDDIPTLDEAAWSHYETNKERYVKLSEALKDCTGNPLENRSLKMPIFRLYQDVLQTADAIFATPCVAATYFSKIFKPDLVIFDEAAHARDLTSLTVIANFSPLCWLFIGDHRQTRPYVTNSPSNACTAQLVVSMMERASKVPGAIKHEMLMNHRAFANLERLPSTLVYDGKMVSGIQNKDRFPTSVQFVQRFFEGFMKGGKCTVPRLIIKPDCRLQPIQVGTSWWHPAHTQWTMDRVIELNSNPEFRNAENPDQPGTMLLLSPYKVAVQKYSKAIKKADEDYPDLNIAQRVEARTWDSSQGNEADIIGIDYVRNSATSFMDDMFRFNVGLTRARQGEWHIMRPAFVNEDRFWETKYLRRLYMACYKARDGHVVVVKP